MIRSEKRITELDLVLARNNPLKIAEAIDILRNSEPLEGAIDLLVSYYNKSNNDSVRRLISGFMNDLKDKSACKEVMEAIRKKLSDETMRMLISSCWQSGLDYSGYTPEFAGIFALTGDYMTAVECFSVIEVSVPKLLKNEKDEIIRIIREDTSAIYTEKKALAADLILLLR